jgi:ribosomal protein L4
MGANVYDILKHTKLIIAKNAIEKLEERLVWTQVLC